MKLTEVCVKKPVLSIVLSLILVIVGLVTWAQLPLRQYPQIEQPIISVSTSFSGASPEIVESQVTRPLENAFAGLEGIDFIESSSENEMSKINLYFRSNRPLDAATNDVRDRLARTQSQLPHEADAPTISKTDADATPIIYLAVSSDRAETQEISDYVTRYLQHQFEAVSGVASVQVTGGGTIEMHVYLDPIRMAGFGITANDVATALKKQNVEKPAGRLISQDREYLVSTTARLSTPRQFEDLVIFERNKYLVRIKDVGRVEMKAKEYRYRARFNGRSAVSVGIIKQSVANPLAISEQINRLLVNVRDNLPPGMSIDIASDRTVFIDRSIKQVYQALIEATVLVIFVILIFLGSVRASFIPLVTIPVSLIAAFSLIYLLNFSVNTLTLLAMVLAIGLVVDDAIVMLENIYRYIEKGMPPLKAALTGSREVSFAVVAMTLTLAAVYAPIALSPGMTGKLFTEFALTLAGAVVISGFVALTLSPMMCARLLKPHNKSKKPGKKAFVQYIDEVYARIEATYVKNLRLALSKKVHTLVMGGLVAGLGLVVGLLLKTELSPEEDQGIIYGRYNAPQAATLEFTDRYALQLEQIIAKIPEINANFTSIIAPSITTRHVMLPWEKRSRTSRQIIDELEPQLAQIIGISGWLQSPKSLGGGDGSSVAFVIQTPRTYEELKDIKDKVVQELQARRVLTNIQSTLELDGQDFVIDIDRDRAASLGIDIAAISETVDILVSGRRFTRFKRDGKEYDVRVEVDESMRRSPQDIENIFMRVENTRRDSPQEMIPLSDLVNIRSRSAPIQLAHFNQMRSVSISGNLPSDIRLGEIVTSIKQIAKDTLPEGMKIDFSGETRRFVQEMNSIYLIFGLALAFIYLVMAAQFESFIDPFIIMLSVPLSMTGGLIVLWFAGGSFNLFSQIGLVTLIGLITKHGILIVDFANTLVEEGKTKIDAIVEASRLRLRPILMTTFAMVLGSVPLAIATGAGAELRQQIGWVIVGGMSFGTLFTLFVVPTVYIYLARKSSASRIKKALDA